MRGITPKGPKICACCQSTEAIERHHLYSIRDGCPDDLQIWLCHVCHERVHRHHFGGIEHERLFRDGIARAKMAGKYKGRKPTVRAKASDILRLSSEGMERRAIARELRIGERSVYRVLADKAKPIA